MKLVMYDSVEQTISQAFIEVFRTGDAFSPWDPALNANRLVLANSLQVLHRLQTDNKIVYERKLVRMDWLRDLICNPDDQGRELISEYSKIRYPTAEETRNAKRIISWFLNVYYPENSIIFSQATYMQFLTSYPNAAPGRIQCLR